MSTRKGSNSRNRPQKYQNRFAFKNDLHDKTPQLKMLNSLHVSSVCERCKAVIEWKIKYKKYKPLTKPKTCIKCQNRNVTKAYHVVCKECAVREKICAKCLKSAEEVRIEPPEPTGEEQQKLKTEMERLVKSLPERKRRTFMRYMAKGKDKDLEAAQDGEELNAAEGDEKHTDEEPTKPAKVPHTREELLKKIEELKLGQDDEDEDFDSDDDYFDSDSCSD